MTDKLEQYRKRRDFARTPEPAGMEVADAHQRFVIQEHHASHLHWDFRLEHNGVLVSWAVPKGVPSHPKENRLAIQTEDHPLSYADFSGEIPRGNYGAGRVILWDRGFYECHKFDAEEVLVTLHGARVEGRYVLFRTKGRNWMIHRMDGPAAGQKPLPRKISPMLATLGTLPKDESRFGFEVKWDGVRSLAYVEGGRVRLVSRTGRDITGIYPEIRGLGAALASRPAVLDGELVALDADGRPDFQRLQHRMGVGSAAEVRRRMREVPVTYIVFDVLHLDGHSLMEQPYSKRREALEALQLEGPAWQTPAHHVGEGSALLAAVTRAALEGVMAKRLDSAYLAGRRSSSWIKIKAQRRQEFVIGGWAEGRAHAIGALLVGYFDAKPPDMLRYAGRVGTGFTQNALTDIENRLRPLEIAATPFSGPVRGGQVHFVQPVLVCEVAFTEWTRSGTLRHPAFKGLRDDKDPRCVVREEEA